MNGVMVKQVSREPKKGAKFFTSVLLVLSILFMLTGIVLSRGTLLLSTITIILYWYYSNQSVCDYEYRMEKDMFYVDVIKGKQYRKKAQELSLEQLEVIAPHWHGAVRKYKKKGGTEKLKKYDYTSYNDDIPYYTMIIYNEKKKKIKLLLDLDEEWLRVLRRQYPGKVIME